jgi:hypothetical protein
LLAVGKIAPLPFAGIGVLAGLIAGGLGGRVLAFARSPVFGND